MRSVAGGLLAAAVISGALAGCGAATDGPHAHVARYLARVNGIERQLGTPVSTIDQVDRQLTASGGKQHSGSGTATGTDSARLSRATEERLLQRATVEIRAVAARLRALRAPAAATHLKALLVNLATRQADLAVQTRRLVAFIPGFSAGLRPLGAAVVALQRALSVNQASGAAAVQQVYADKAAALRAFAGALDGILASLGRLQPPSSSRPAYVAERRSLLRMRDAALTLAGDLAAGRTTQVPAVLRAFDRAAGLPASQAAQQAGRNAIRAYDHQVGELGALVTAANRERLRLAATLH